MYTAWWNNMNLPWQVIFASWSSYVQFWRHNYSLLPKRVPNVIFDAKYYEKTDGVAMGLPVGPVWANIFMRYFEEKWVMTGNPRPSICFRLCWWHHHRVWQQRLCLTFYNNLTVATLALISPFRSKKSVKFLIRTFSSNSVPRILHYRTERSLRSFLASTHSGTSSCR